MFVALGFLLGLVALCVAMPFVDGAILPAFVPLLVAVGLIIVSLRLPQLETQRFGDQIKYVALGALIPALWMLLQTAPAPAGLAHPVWASVAAGFPNPVVGHISVDIGATAMALVRYLGLVGAILLTAALAINRERAEITLVALAVAATLVSLGLIISEIVADPTATLREEAVSVACLGLVLTGACISLVLERHETRRAKLGFRNPKFVYPMAATLTGLAICVVAILTSRSGSIIFAASCGFGLFLALVAVRRLSLGRWGAVALGLTGTVIAVALASGAAGTSSDPRLAFVKKDVAAVELTQRILADTPFFGDGAGAFDSILPIYQFGEAGQQERRAVTAAAQLSIEMGRLMLWSAVVTALVGAAWLMRASSNRGRDSFYAAATASSLATLVALAFVNMSLFTTSLPLLSAILIGLGVAQSQGRSG